MKTSILSYNKLANIGLNNLTNKYSNSINIKTLFNNDSYRKMTKNN